MVSDYVKSLLRVITHTNNMDSRVTAMMSLSVLNNFYCRKIRLFNAK